MFPFDTFPSISNLIATQNIRGLINVFSHTDKYLAKEWNEAYDALINIGKPAVQSLIDALNDEHIYTRGQVIKILGEIGDKRAVDPLIKALDSYLHINNRGEISKALGKIGDKRAVEPIIKILEDNFKNHELAHQAHQQVIEALGRIGDSRAVEILIKELNCDSGAARWQAVEALGEIGDERAVGHLLAVTTDDDDLAVRSKADEALGKIRGHKSK